jgi:hypothetical protein
MRRLNTIIWVSLVAVVVSSCSPTLAATGTSIYDLLMPGQKPTEEITLPDPPAYIKSMVANFVTAKSVEQKTYALRPGVSDSDITRNAKSVMPSQGWNERHVEASSALFSRDIKDDSVEFMYIDIRDKEHRVIFTKISGTKSDNNTGINPPMIQKQVPAALTGLRIAASGPSMQYEAWTKDVVQVRKIQPTGQFRLPDIASEGSDFRVDLPASLLPQAFGMSGLDYAISAPQRLATYIDSTGSQLTVTLTGVKSLTLKAANAPVTIVGAFDGGNHSIEVVNQRATFNLTSVTAGQMKVTATNAEVIANLPKNCSVQVSAHSVAGGVTVHAEGQPAVTDNPFKQSYGAGAAQLTLESVGGKITLNFK